MAMRVDTDALYEMIRTLNSTNAYLEEVSHGIREGLVVMQDWEDKQSMMFKETMGNIAIEIEQTIAFINERIPSIEKLIQLVEQYNQVRL